MISGIIKVEESVISFIIHWSMENIQKLLPEMQADFSCACKKYKGKCTKWPHHSKPGFSQRCFTHAHCARYNLRI